MNPCITMSICVCLLTVLAKSVQGAEPFSEPWISAANGIAAINHPPLLNEQTIGNNTGYNFNSNYFTYNKLNLTFDQIIDKYIIFASHVQSITCGTSCCWSRSHEVDNVFGHKAPRLSTRGAILSNCGVNSSDLSILSTYGVNLSNFIDLHLAKLVTT